MPLLPIRRFPDQILRRPSQIVRRITPEIETYIDDMIETMYASPGTIGLAAPQAGIPIRLIVLDVSSKERRNGLIVLMNPVLVRGEGSKVIREGCLSLPDYTGNVRRFERVVVKGLERTGKDRLIDTTGVEAICLQHEIDHVDGMMFLDRVDSLKTDIFRRKKYL